MDFFPKYRCEFCDIIGLQWVINIEEWAAIQGVITPMKATGDPLNIEFFSDSEELFDSPVKGSKADLTIYSETDFQWIGIYSAGDFEYRMSIYAGANLYWQGYILAESYSEPYDGTAYPVTISAGDGLGVLKNILYDDDGTYYDGRKTQSQILYDILSKIQFYGFTEYLNIYEERMDQAATDSPLDQCLIDVDVFKDMYCYEVLQELLKSYNALIRQVNGVMTIYRPAELSQVSINGRTFTSGTAKSAATALVPEQFINRTANPSDRLSVNGGNLTVVPSAKTVKLNQDYGYKNNWLENGEFKGSTFDAYNTTEMFQNWINTASALRLITNELYLSDEPDGMVIPARAGVYTYQAYQSFGVNAIISDDLLVYEFKYLHSNYSGVDIKYVRLSMSVRSADGNYLYIIDDEYMGWSATPQDIDFGSETVKAGNTGWKTIQRKIAGLVADGPYRVSIFNSFNLHDTVHIEAITTAFKDVRFYATSDEINSKKYPGFNFPFVIFPKKGSATIFIDNKEIVGKEYSGANAANGIDIEYDYKLGDVDDSGIDNVVEQFQGCLTLPSVDFTATWNTISPGGEAAALLSIINGEIKAQYSRPQQLLQLPVIEGKSVDNTPHINLIGNFQDSLNLIGAVNRMFVFGSGSIKVKMRSWDISLIELVKIILA